MDAPVGLWLPASWNRGPGINTLTFADLMTHRSGLDGNRNRGVSLAELRSYIAAGIEPADKTVLEYQNANFALLRIIIPFLHYGPPAMNTLETVMDLDWPTAVLYRDLVRARVLSQAGVQGDCNIAEGSQPATLSYAYPPSAFPGGFGASWAGPSGFLNCSAGGWLFSARELATILAIRRHTNLILSPTARAVMDERLLGWRPRPGLLGTYRSHGGLLITSDTPSRGLSACWMELPNGVEASAMVNSFNGALHYACDMLKDAFEDALVPAPEPPVIHQSGGGV